jgi:DNA-binding CsgD family transcriptional regulator
MGPAPITSLTTREVEILRLVTGGLTNRQLAEELGISPRTVDAHLRSIYAKLGVSSRSAATRYAIVHHLVGDISARWEASPKLLHDGLHRRIVD